jgi:serine/threonine protein kinase
MDEQERVRL